MELWACSPLGKYVDFICVCVDDNKNVAINFEQMFKFTSVINGVVMKRQDMPTYGQLGCSGFIIVGADGSCVSKKTDAYLNYGEKAFKNAESIILTALEDAGIDFKTESNKKDGNIYAKGQKLRLEGISSDLSLNGIIVTVLKFDTTKGRFHVLLNDGSNKQISILPCNLAPLEIDSTTAITITKSINPPNLIGCKLIDAEHADCTAAINMCLSDCTKENLTLVLNSLEKHFQHEELLAKDSGFGDVNDSFSPMYSHAKDHERILNSIRAQLGDTCCTQQLSDTIDMNTIYSVASAFLDHAKTFDVLLEGKL